MLGNAWINAAKEHAVNSLILFVKRNRLLSFIVLAYAFSWWPFLLYSAGMFPVAIASFGPFLAAIVVLLICEGREGAKTLLGRMVRWRVGIRWYLVALGLPIILSALASYLAVLMGAPAPTMEQLSNWPAIFATFPIVLLVPGLGGAWEEPGWRGFAVHQLESRRSRLWALLPLWAIICLWHLPLFLTGDIEWADVANMVGGVIVYNWLYHRSGDSVLLVMIIHAMNNAASGEFFSPMFTGIYSVQQAWMRVLVWSVVAVVVLVTNWRWWCESEQLVTEVSEAVVKAA